MAKPKPHTTEDRIMFLAVFIAHLIMTWGGMAMAVITVLAEASLAMTVLWLSVSAVGMFLGQIARRMYDRLNSDKASRQRAARRR